jgi:hypothetical protein
LVPALIRRDSMVIAEIGMGYGALKKAYEIAKSLKDINDQVALNSAVIELQNQILSAQDAAQTARERVADLEARLAELLDWKAIADRYQLKDFGESTFAYELKADKAEGEPAHLICANCFQQRKRSILQYTHGNGRRYFDCQSCKTRQGLGADRR